MIHPRIDELLDNVDSPRYALVIVAAKRARQINDYHHQLGEGIGFEQAPPPLVESRSKKLLDHGPRGSRRGQAQVQVPQVGSAEGGAEPELRRTGRIPCMARVLVGVTGGIAAYKACDLVRLLVKGGHDVVPLVTPGTERFVRPRRSSRSRGGRPAKTSMRISRAATCSSLRP